MSTAQGLLAFKISETREEVFAPAQIKRVNLPDLSQELFGSGGTGQIFGDGYQAMWTADEDPSSSALDQAFVFPAAENSTDGVQGGAGHLGQVLTGEREINQHSTFHLTPRLPDQPQQRAGNAALYPFCRHLSEAILQLLNALS